MNSASDNSKSSAKIVYLTAGAGGMFCGSCMHDNALAKALTAAGWDVMLVPFYTPIRTDESDVSIDQVFFGGINVFLQQKIPLFRYLPSFFDRILDNPKLIRRVTKKAIETDAKVLGSLALSMLKGAQGNQRKEVKRVNKWLLEKQLDIPVLITLQGDDVFLNSLPANFKNKCIDQVKRIAEHVDGFVVHSQYFGDYMCDYFDLDPAKLHVTPLGLDVTDFKKFLGQTEVNSAKSETRDGPLNHKTIGYLARIAPEKGTHNLVEAFVELKQKQGTENIKLQLAGWLGKECEGYAAEQWKALEEAGLKDDFEYLGSIDRETKLKMLGEIDVLTVPTDQKEPKGLFILEALAAGVPVVQPAHGSFPEMVDQTGGGVVYEPGDNSTLAKILFELLTDEERRKTLGQQGQQAVHQDRCDSAMAEVTGAVFRKFLDA